MKGLDPRSKLVMVLSISSLAVFVEEPLILFPLVLLSFFLAAACGSAPCRLLIRLRRVLWIFFAMAVIQSIFVSGGRELLEVGEVVLLTADGLVRGLVIIFRIVIIIVSAAIMTSSTSREIIQGLSQWGIPYELTFMIGIAVRFLPLLKQEAQDVLTAIQMRGVELEKIPLRKKLKTYYHLLLPLLYSVVIKSRRLAVAVEMRAFRAFPERTSYRVLSLDRRDYLVIALSLLSTVGILAGYYWIL